MTDVAQVSSNEKLVAEWITFTQETSNSVRWYGWGKDVMFMHPLVLI